MWAKPYNVPQIIETIDTGLPKQFKYSPLFKQPAVKADVDIELTGFRTRDYKAAERASGITHTPDSTV